MFFSRIFKVSFFTQFFKEYLMVALSSFQVFTFIVQFLFLLLVGRCNFNNEKLSAHKMKSRQRQLTQQPTVVDLTEQHPIPGLPPLLI